MRERLAEACFTLACWLFEVGERLALSPPIPPAVDRAIQERLAHELTKPSQNGPQL